MRRPLHNPERIAIYDRLVSKGAMTVKELSDDLQMPSKTITSHLIAMRYTGYVGVKEKRGPKEGKKVWEAK